MLTENAIKQLNNDFANGNPYSRSMWDWAEYYKRINRLINRLRKQNA